MTSSLYELHQSDDYVDSLLRYSEWSQKNNRWYKTIKYSSVEKHKKLIPYLRNTEHSFAGR